MSVKDRSYWQVNSIDGGYKLDENNKRKVIQALEFNQPFIEVKDIFGTDVGYVLTHITDWHRSTPAIRIEALKFVNQLNADEGAAAKIEEKPEWEQ